MNIPQTINAAIRRVTGYSLIRTGSTKSYNWSYLYPLGGAGVGGENHDLLRTDNGAALAQTISVAAYRAVEARRLAVGSMPWRIVNVDNGNEITTSEDPHPKHLFGVALHQANSVLGQSLFSAWEMSMIITGKAFIEPYKNEYGRYTSIRWINPTDMTIYAPNDTVMGFQYRYDGKQETRFPTEIIYERFPNLVSDVYGLSPLYVAMARINISVNTDRYLNAFFRNDGRFGQIISPKDATVMVDDLEIQQIKNQVSGAKGSDNAYRTFITKVPFDVHYPDQVDLSKHIDMMERVETSIYTTLGVPRPVAGDVDGQRYQASPESLEWFYQNVIIPRCRDIQRLVNSDLLPRFGHDYNVRFEFDTSEWERISPTRMAQLEIVERGFNDGVITLNERRNLLQQYVPDAKIEPINNGDVLKVNGVYIPLNNLAPAPALPTLVDSESADSGIIDAVQEDIQQAENPATLAAQQDALSELRTWRKYAKKHGAAKALEFDTQHLDDWQVLRVKHGVADGNEQEAFSAIDSVITGFVSWQPHSTIAKYNAAYSDSVKDYTDSDELIHQHALSILAQKAIQATRSDFENDVEDLLIEAVAGNIDRVRFGNRLRNLVQVAIGKAYLDGLEDGGISEPELTTDDKDWIGNFFNEQREYIINISDAIYKDGRVTEDETASKPSMWYNKSVSPSYYEGISSASRNGAFEWALGNREEHCRSCVRLNGQVRRMSYWRSNIMPQSGELQCRGFNCGCNLVPTRKGISRGRLPAWRSHTHE